LFRINISGDKDSAYLVQYQSNYANLIVYLTNLLAEIRCYDK